ncbi:MAG: hemolysin family protein [Phycisphaerae bacterium]|nr:hemolysin family protein [Phycisphaerae bacterium]
MGATELSLAALMPPLLVGSAFWSACETAIFGLSGDDRASLRHGSPRTSKRVELLLAQPRQLLITVLLANMTVNTLYFVISSMVIARSGFGIVGNVTVGVLTLLFVVLGGEVLPKMLADAKRRRVVPLLVPGLYAVHQAILPIRLALDRLIIAPLSRLTAPGDAPPRLSAAELAAMLELSGAAGVLDADEQQLLRGVFELRRLRVRDVMTPRVDMAWIELGASRQEVVELARTERLTRLPVVGKDIDDVQGILQVKRFLLDPRGDATPISDHVRTVRFVPEVASVEHLLEHLRETRGDLAIVVDEYGGTAGVVAIEDCVEEIVGDIVSPEEEAEPPPRQLSANTWIVPGDTNLRRWADAFGERYLNSRASTLGGFLLEHLGRPVQHGDVVHVANLRLEVETMRGSRVRRVLVTLEDDDTNSDAAPTNLSDSASTTTGKERG